MNYKHSRFIYGHIVTEQNRYIDFTENGEVVTGVMALGAYSLTGYLIEASRAMTEAGEYRRTLTVDRETLQITISLDDIVDPGYRWDLLFYSGPHSQTSAHRMMGFEDEDKVNLNGGAQGPNPAGTVFFPQAPINEYVPFIHWRGANDSSVQTNSNGTSVIVGFGEVQRMRCNIRAITNALISETSILKNNQNAVQEALDFMNYIIQKNPIEFSFDIDTPDEYDQCILESTKDSKAGTSFELYEGLKKGLLGWYETDTLVFRRIE